MLISNPKNGRRTRLRRNIATSFSTTALRETASGLACTSHTVLFEPSSHILDATGLRRHWYNCALPAISKTQILGFRGATEAPPRPKFGCYPLNGREAGDTRVQVSVCRPKCPPHQTIQISSVTRRGCAEQHPVDDAWERRREGRLTQLRNVLIFFLR